MSFKDIYLAIAEKEFNLFIAETMQMSRYKDIDLKSIPHEELTLMILKDISKGKIQSSHYTKKQAKNLIKLINM